MVAGAGVGLAAVPAAAAMAAAKPAVSRQHVSPFGLRAHRAVHHVQRRADAPAVTGTTRWVSNTTALGTAPGTSCADPGYATISAAITASALGDTIEVCAGTYDEQLAITQGITLQAKGPVTVVGPATFPSNATSCDTDGGSQPNQDVVDICGTGTVKISGFTIQGGWPAGGYCYDSFYGVAVLGGANLVLSNSTVENIGDGSSSGSGCQGGVGIEVGLATSPTAADAGTATLNNDVVNTYQKNGITVDGTGSSATINDATVTGAGASTATAQNGIQISDNATGKINTGSVSGNECDDTGGGCGPNGLTQTQACGILLFDAGKVTVTGANSSANDIGVDNIEDVAWAFYTPPSPFIATNEALTSMRLNNRYENAFLDEGKTTLNDSTLSNGEVGIETDQASYQTTPAVSVANGDTITGASQDAILIASDHTSGDKAPKLTVATSSFDTTNAYGVENDSTSVATATDNYWGDPSGPSLWSFGSGSQVSADVNFFPWALDTGYTNKEQCTTGASVSSSTNDQVLCAPSGNSNAFLSNGASGNVLEIGNSGNDQLVGTTAAGGETWIISGTGFIQKRGDANDTITNAANYNKALR
ncbi:MAG TPA: hypothetical protein VK784_03800 [Pseudonocardiaceae bacterium]|nr:hypothetical protein [Pseudonocardiaceae bacterium]